MSRDLDRIEDLAGIIFEAELARLNEASGELQMVKAELEALAEARRDRARHLDGASGAEDLAYLLGKDELWSEWLAQARSRLLRKAAEIAARREKALLIARQALGKREALRQIREADATARLQQSRRRNGS